MEERGIRGLRYYNPAPAPRQRGLPNYLRDPAKPDPMPTFFPTPAQPGRGQPRHALLTSAELIAEVVGGTTLTDALAACGPPARPPRPASVNAILDLTYGTRVTIGGRISSSASCCKKPLPEPLQSAAAGRPSTASPCALTPPTRWSTRPSARRQPDRRQVQSVANGVLRNALRQAGEPPRAPTPTWLPNTATPPWWDLPP